MCRGGHMTLLEVSLTGYWTGRTARKADRTRNAARADAPVGDRVGTPGNAKNSHAPAVHMGRPLSTGR